jgi:hypothetical protein
LLFASVKHDRLLRVCKEYGAKKFCNTGLADSSRKIFESKNDKNLTFKKEGNKRTNEQTKSGRKREGEKERKREGEKERKREREKERKIER